MSIIIPTRVFLTKGYGQHKEKLASLEQALRMAGIAPFNLVKVSSIFPPGCKLITRGDGVKNLKPGQITFLVMSECATDEAHRKISSSIGVAIPNDINRYGYLSEHHSFGQDEKEAGQYAEDLAAWMLATTLGQDFDPDQIWNEERSAYELGDGIVVKTKNVTMTTKGKKGFWTPAIAAAVFIP